MNPNKRISRKTFFKWATVSLALPFAYLWQSTVSRSRAFEAKKQSLRVDAGLPDGIYFHDRVILVKDEGGLRLLSSKCTHLGCKINKSEDGEMVCPCHGSRYNRSGVPVKGPAVDPLPEIPFSIEQEDSGLVLRYEL